MCVPVCLCVRARAHINAGDFGASDPSELELQTVVRCLKWELATDSRSSS